MTNPAATASQPKTASPWQSLINPAIDTGWNPTPGSGQRNDYSVAIPQGTPIVAPVSGIVLPQNTGGGGDYSYYGRQPWGGEVDILTSMSDYPGGLQNVNILHFDTINVKPGDMVVAGQTVLGTSGGQTSGGTMPSSPTYSTGPHIGLGVHSVPNWNQMWNPQTLITNLLAGRDTSSIPAQNQVQGAGVGWLPRGSLLSNPLAGGNVVTGKHSGPPDATPPNAPAPPPQPTPDPCSQFNSIDPRYWWCKLTTAATGSAGGWFQSPLGRGVKIVGGTLLMTAAVVLFVAGSIGGDILAAGATASGVPEAAPFLKRAAGKRTPLTRRVGSGIQARGALAGKETLKKTQERGELVGTKRTVQAFHLKAVRSSRLGKITGAINKEREGLGFPRLSGKQMRERSISRSNVLTAPEKRELEEREALQRARAERRQAQYQGMGETLRNLRGEGGEPTP